MGLSEGAKNKVSIVGSAGLNLAEYAFKTEEQNIEVKVPLTVSSTAIEHHPILCISINMLDVTDVQEPTDVQIPVVPLPFPLVYGEACVTEKDEVSALKASLRKDLIGRQWKGNSAA